MKSLIGRHTDRADESHAPRTCLGSCRLIRAVVRFADASEPPTPFAYTSHDPRCGAGDCRDAHLDVVVAEASSWGRAQTNALC